MPLILFTVLHLVPFLNIIKLFHKLRIHHSCKVENSRVSDFFTPAFLLVAFFEINRCAYLVIGLFFHCCKHMPMAKSYSWAGKHSSDWGLICSRTIMRVSESGSLKAILSQENHLIRGLWDFKLVTIKATGIPQPAASCLTDIVYRNIFRWLSSIENDVLCAEFRNKIDKYFKNTPFCQLMWKAKKNMSFHKFYPQIPLQVLRHHPLVNNQEVFLWALPPLVRNCEFVIRYLGRKLLKTVESIFRRPKTSVVSSTPRARLPKDIICSFQIHITFLKEFQSVPKVTTFWHHTLLYDLSLNFFQVSTEYNSWPECELWKATNIRLSSIFPWALIYAFHSTFREGLDRTCLVGLPWQDFWGVRLNERYWYFVHSKVTD